jgi:soluble lytic murein transglycosylase-like protein
MIARAIDRAVAGAALGLLFAGTDAPAPAAAETDDPPPVLLGGASAIVPTLRSPLASTGSDREVYRTRVREEASLAGIPPDFADAIAEVESGYHSRAIGTAGEVGLMQVLPSTARMLGFEGTAEELAAPEVNIHYGVTYLAQAWRLAGGDICTAAMKYRAGHGETRFSYLSVEYCVRVRSALMARGFVVTGIVPTATFGEPSRSRLRVVPIGGRGPNLDAFNDRLRAFTNAVSARGAFQIVR